MVAAVAVCGEGLNLLCRFGRIVVVVNSSDGSQPPCGGHQGEDRVNPKR